MAEETIWRGPSSQLQNLGLYLVCGLFFWLVVPLFFAIARYLQTKNRVYELTTERFKITEGIFSKATSTIELYRVKDIEVRQPFIYRMLGVENIHVTTSDVSNPAAPARRNSDGGRPARQTAQPGRSHPRAKTRARDRSRIVFFVERRDGADRQGQPGHIASFAIKALVFVICLLLSLPNLLAGLALAVVERTFVSRHPLDIVDHFLESVVWGIPIAAGVLLILLLAGIITESRPYSAVCLLLLNLVALGLVLFRISPPQEIGQVVFFLPVLVAMIGLGWIAFAWWRTVRASDSPLS